MLPSISNDPFSSGGAALQMQQAAQQRALAMGQANPNPVVQDLGPGTLHIRDTFTPSSQIMSMEVPHGLQVMSAAQQQAGGQPKVAPSFGDQPNPAAVFSFDPLMERMNTQRLTKDEALKDLGKAQETEFTRFLDDQSAYLGRLSDKGVKNSAANFSLGKSKASQTFSLYEDAMSTFYANKNFQGSPTSTRGKELSNLAANYATAFDVDQSKITHSDQKIQKAEEAKFHQNLTNFVSSTVDSSGAIKKSQEKWDTAVSRFEGRNNSVVVSAGNEGDIDDAFQNHTGTKQNFPADFEKNALENPQVTSVGATDASGQRAAYSSQSGGVDILANGELPGGVQGTSFAAPRVGLAMAELHGRYPDKSSAQIEAMLQKNLTVPGSSANGNPAVLKPDANLNFLRNTKF